MLHAMEEGSIAPMNLQEFLKDLKFEDLTQSNYAFGTTIKTSDQFWGHTKYGSSFPDEDACYFRFKSPNPTGEIKSAVLRITTFPMIANREFSDAEHYNENLTQTTTSAGISGSVEFYEDENLGTSDWANNDSRDLIVYVNKNDSYGINNFLYLTLLLDGINGGGHEIDWSVWKSTDGGTTYESYLSGRAITENATNPDGDDVNVSRFTIGMPITENFSSQDYKFKILFINRTGSTLSTSGTNSVIAAAFIVPYAHTHDVSAWNTETSYTNASVVFDMVQDSNTPSQYYVWLGLTSGSPTYDQSSTWQTNALWSSNTTDAIHEFDLTEYIEKNKLYTIKIKSATTPMTVFAQMIYEFIEDDI